jgi:hypothetical protein
MCQSNSTKRGSIHDNQVKDERTDSIEDERFNVKYTTIKFSKERKIHDNQVKEERMDIIKDDRLDK